MDEVPIPNNNPVIIKSDKPEVKTKPKKTSRLLETLKNFIYMFPLALIIAIELYYLGYRFGEFITFPPTTVVTYIFLGCILLMLLVIQIMMRSIIYSIFVGITFLTGIFAAWFGSVYHPVINNLSSIYEIVTSAWSRKNIPFELLVTGSITFIYTAVIFIQFLTSLVVKSFFEMIFGKNWGDGKIVGYLGAICIILGIYISFNSYHNYATNNKEKLKWKYFQHYTPMEKFVTRMPGNVTYNDEYLWVNNSKEIVGFNLETGRLANKQKINSVVVCKGINKANYPVAPTKDGFIVYEQDLSSIKHELPYPNINASDTSSARLIPLTINFLKDSNLMISFYDYGKVALYNIEEGEELWCETINVQTKASRVIADNYIDDITFIENKNKIIIACQNGYVKSIDKKTGKTDWFYEHNVPKIGGKPQRGYLSKNDDKSFVVSFKSGEILTLSYKDGHILYRAVNEIFAMNDSIFCNDRKGNFITDDGLYYYLELEGGKILSRINALPNKSEIYPIVQDNENSIYAHRENIYHVSKEDGYSSIIFSCKNRTFVTKPLLVDKTLYIGTQDGLIFCIHYGSKNVKWFGHVDGELIEDSLAITDDKLIVKTKSDSIFVFNKNYVQ